MTRPISGWIPLILIPAALLVGISLVVCGVVVGGVVAENGLPILLGILLVPVMLICLFGFQAISPNDSRVLLQPPEPSTIVLNAWSKRLWCSSPTGSC